LLPTSDAPIIKYARALAKIADKAYPNLSEEDRGVVLVDQFLKKAPSDVRMMIKLSRTKKWKEVLKMLDELCDDENFPNSSTKSKIDKIINIG